MVSTRSAASKQTSAVSRSSPKSTSARRRSKASPKRVARKTRSVTPVTIEGDVDAGHISGQGTFVATSTTSVTNCENCDTSVIEKVEDLRIEASAKLRPDRKKPRSTRDKGVQHSVSKQKSGQRGKDGVRFSDPRPCTTPFGKTLFEEEASFSREKQIIPRIHRKASPQQQNETSSIHSSRINWAYSVTTLVDSPTDPFLLLTHDN